MSQNILAIGAHPDDIELGCGGTIAKHLSLGHCVFALIMTNGEKGNHSWSKEECISSLKELGLKEPNILFGNFSDGYLLNNIDVVSFIERTIKDFKITKVYTHYPDDRHQDHYNCSRAVSSAARRIPELLFFQGPSTHSLFDPHYFIELPEEYVEKKVNALNYYQSQIRKGGLNTEWVKSLAIVNGLRCNTRFAEAFALNHVLREGGDV